MTTPQFDISAVDAPALQRASRALSQARAQCVALGVPAGELGTLLLEEAMLAWLMAGWSEREVCQRLLEAIGKDVRQWYRRVRIAAEQCDCALEAQEGDQGKAQAVGTGWAKTLGSPGLFRVNEH